MSKELIHLDDHRGQLMCDSPACGHMLAEGEVTWGEHLIGHPCPKCGSDMLTREDYEGSERAFAAVRWLNKWFGWLGSEYVPNDPKWKHKIAVRHHDGKTIINEEK